MNYKTYDKTVVLDIVGELNSSNAETVEKECIDIISKGEYNYILLNLHDLIYISSAGLRIVLRLKQKYKNVVVVEASLEVYNILQMTGFTNIIECHKKLAEISTDGLEIIGDGFFSTVYRIDKDTIVKVFNRTSDPNQIERELRLAKTAFILGIPTAISFDIVRVKEKLGVRFEMLDCMSLKNFFIKYPDKYQELLNKYVQLLKKINSTECLDENIPNMHNAYKAKVEGIKNQLTIEQYEKAKRLVDNIEEKHTLVHGDCHFKNIMVQGDEFLLIDMDTLSVGNPIFELSQLMAPYIAFEQDDPGNSEKFLGVTGKFAKKLFYDIVDLYYGKSEEVKQKIALLCYIHMVWWVLINSPDNLVRLNGNKERLIKLLDVVDDLNIGD